jgi:hypothetical protein
MSDDTALTHTLVDDPRRLAAAYCLGQPAYEYRVWQEAIWQTPYFLWAKGRGIQIMMVLDLLEEAFTDLTSAINVNIFTTLPPVLTELRAFAEEVAHDLGKEGSYCGVSHGRGPTPENTAWPKLCQILPQALPVSSDLQRLLTLGTAFGQLQLAAYEESVGEPTSATITKEQPGACAREVFRVVKALPARITSAVPKLQVLVGLCSEDNAQCLASIVTSAGGHERIPRWMDGMATGALFEATWLLSDDIETQLRALPPCQEAVRPHWDYSYPLTMYYGNVVCKRYERPAPRQTKILDAFEKLNWPKWIANPLKEGGLKDTIKDLQQGTKNSPIIIERDGTGKGVTWGQRRPS